MKTRRSAWRICLKSWRKPSERNIFRMKMWSESTFYRATSIFMQVEEKPACHQSNRGTYAHISNEHLRVPLFR